MRRNEVAALHAQTKQFSVKCKRARDVVRRALQKCSSPYVALSGGKDSTVVLHLVREHIPDVPAVWSDDEWFLPETEEYINRLMDAGVNVHRIRTNARHASWFSVSGDWDGIPDYAQHNGWDLVFLGLRMEESASRRLYLRSRGPLHKCGDGFWRCNPIWDWSWLDVWAFIVSRGLDYNKAYDKLEELGIPPQEQRIGPLAVERVLGRGQLVILKRGWPDLFNRFAEKYPQATQYI